MAVPVVTTTPATGVSEDAATSGGVLVDDTGEEVTAYGVCWNTTGSPTIADDHTDEAGWKAGHDTHPELFEVVPNATITSGAQGSPTVYTYKRFVRSGATPVVYLQSESSGSQKHDIDFVNCIFDCDYGTYQNTHSPFTINDRDGWTHRIRFFNCWFKGYFDGNGYSLHQMSFECTGRANYSTSTYTRGTTYTGIEMYDCVFDAAGAEGCSFDDYYNGVYGQTQDQGIIVERCVVRGAGNKLNPSYDQGFELNGNRGVTVRQLKVYRTRGTMLNFTGPGVGEDSNWLFEGIVADYTATSATVRTTRSTRIANGWVTATATL